MRADWGSQNTWLISGFLGLVVLIQRSLSHLPPLLSATRYIPFTNILVKVLAHLLLFVFPFSVDEKTRYLALGAVKNISLNISISNLGDDAYDANVSFNVSRELFFINMWQKVRRPCVQCVC